MKRKTVEEFIKECKIIHNNKFDYSKTHYNGADSKVVITCPIHGDFEIISQHHLEGQGCTKCNNEVSRAEKLYNFINEAKKIHNNFYDYKNVNFIRNDEKVEVICPIHGSFFITPKNHLLNKAGCKQCGIEKRSKIQSKSQDTFIKELQKIYGDLYDFSKVEYVNNKTKVIVTCPIHGDYHVSPKSLLKGKKCAKCAALKRGKNKRLTREEFIKKANKIHRNKYDYSDSIFITTSDKITIKCEKHGYFTQYANSHLRGRGCPLCSYNGSKWQEEIYSIIKKIFSENIIIKKNDRSVLFDIETGYCKELDLYIPFYNIGIELNSIIWHSKMERRKPGYHKKKYKLCKDNGIKLINLCYEQWVKNKEKVEKKLLERLEKIINEK